MPSTSNNDHNGVVVNYDEIKETLLEKIKLYKERNWIDEKEEQQFRTALLSATNNPNATPNSTSSSSSSSIEKSIKGVHKWLHAIEKAHRKDGSNTTHSRSKSKSRKKEKKSSLSSDDEKLRKKLLATIKVYRQRQWIDETEEDGLRSLLLSNEIDNFAPSTKSLETMQKRLHAIKKEKLKNESSARKETKRQMSLTPIKRNSSFNTDDHYKVYMAEELADTLSSEATESLFTEMCVFAKMGFLQPTSCLHCAFNQLQSEQQNSRNSQELTTTTTTAAEKEIEMNKPCDNYVIWRRDAGVPIHPQKLDNNLLIVSCSTAKAWMQGETVQGRKWDKNTKQIISNVKQ